MARFDRLTVWNTIVAERLVPLFYHRNPATAENIAAALAKGGSHILEFTNRGDFAIDVFSTLIRQSAQSHPDLIIGAGSIEDAPTAALFIAYGANFIVGPTFDEQTARLCNRHKVAYLPGCATVTEIAVAEEWGAEIVKLFPGETVGGPGFVKAILGPRPWSRLMPTGGASADETNLRSWFEAGVVAVGMGSKLIRNDWVEQGSFDAIQASTQHIIGLINTITAKAR